MAPSPRDTESRMQEILSNPPCRRYVAGHAPHYIQVMRVAVPIDQVRAVVGEPHADGGVWITLTFADGRTESWWNHDVARAEAALSVEQPCEWRTTGVLLVGEISADRGLVFCLSATPNLIHGCPATGDEAGLEVGSGGFLIDVPNIATMTDRQVKALARRMARALELPERR